MSLSRRHVLAGLATAPLLSMPARAAAPGDVLEAWYRLALELVRHTPTYSPPVASRAFAYLGVTVFESVASGNGGLVSLAGQLNGLEKLPAREEGPYDDGVILHSAIAAAANELFSHTGPTGQRAMAKMTEKTGAKVGEGVAADVLSRSQAHGEAVARHILAWSQGDGGSEIVNMGFPLRYELTKGPAHWVPTSAIAQQQVPLLPGWPNNRTFAIPDGGACPLPPPPEYSEDKNSEFYREAFETYETRLKLTEEQRVIARFWSDDPMLSPTPPGHWISIVLAIAKRDSLALERSVEVLARLGITMADAFIACWQQKYEYDLLRPVTYIRRVIDPAWEPLLITPPFPEYPSGHSTQSGAAATVLTAMFGENFAFTDATHERDGLPARTFPSFWAAAEEAAISRLYGGIHFRAACERGLDQGRCVGAHAVALKMRA